MSLGVRSSVFSEGSPIPRKYTCDGENASPPLDWDGVPHDTKTLALICDDPDAPSGTFTHWVLYNIPGSARALSEHTDVGTAGVNSFGKRGFGGPCPPRHDRPHHYHFHVYALDIDSLGPAGLSKEAVVRKMTGHVVDEGETVGTYAR